MSIVKAAGYDPSVYLMDALPAGGFKGQPVYIQRQPVTFKENANRSRTMFFESAHSRTPPASEISCTTVVGPSRGYVPGFETMPVIVTLRLLICRTTIVTVGSATNFVAASVMATRSCSGVRPAA